MKGKLTLVMLGILILFASTAGAVGRPAINFGTYIAPEQVSKTVATLVPLVDSRVEYLEVWLESNLATTDKRITLEGQRLKLELPGGVYLVDLDPVTIPTDQQLLTDDNTTALPMLINYTVFPNDLPGIYRGVLVVREMGAEGLIQENRTPLQLEVDYWVNIKTNMENILLGGFSSKDGILVSNPGEVWVASNVPWKLTVKLFEADELSKGNLELIILSSEDSEFIKTNQEAVKLGQASKTLAEGNSTVGPSGKYWVPVSFMLQLTDYHQVSAGIIPFSMGFSVEPNLD